MAPLYVPWHTVNKHIYHYFVFIPLYIGQSSMFPNGTTLTVHLVGEKSNVSLTRFIHVCTLKDCLYMYMSFPTSVFLVLLKRMRSWNRNMWRKHFFFLKETRNSSWRISCPCSFKLTYQRKGKAKPQVAFIAYTFKNPD